MMLFNPYTLGALALAAALSLGGAYVKGRADAGARCEARIEKMVASAKAEAEAERQRQEDANKAALALADKLADQLAKKDDDLANALDDLAGAASDDPNADRVCLGPDSVRRLRALVAGS